MFDVLSSDPVDASDPVDGKSLYCSLSTVHCLYKRFTCYVCDSGPIPAPEP